MSVASCLRDSRENTPCVTSHPKTWEIVNFGLGIANWLVGNNPPFAIRNPQCGGFGTNSSRIVRTRSSSIAECFLRSADVDDEKRHRPDGRHLNDFFRPDRLHLKRAHLIRNRVVRIGVDRSLLSRPATLDSKPESAKSRAIVVSARCMRKPLGEAASSVHNS